MENQPEENQGSTILIVDDEPELLHAIKLKVQELGYDFLEAENGRQALQILSEDTENKIEVVLTDLYMPVMNGIQFLAKCREQNRLTPIIFLTGNGSKETLHEALKLGAFDYLEKPFNTKTMAPLLHSAVSENMRIQENDAYSKILIKTNHQNSGFPNIDFSSTSFDSFVSQSINQIGFCRTALTQLKNEPFEITMKEVGFLFRTTREIAFSASNVGLFDLSDAATHLMECLIFFRTNPSALNIEAMDKIDLGLKSILTQLESYENQDSNESQQRKMRSQMFSFKHELYVNSTLK